MNCIYCYESIDPKARICKNCGKNLRFNLWEFLNSSFVIWCLTCALTFILTVYTNHLVTNWENFTHKSELIMEINFRINNSLKVSKKILENGVITTDSVYYSILKNSLFYNNPKADNYFDSLSFNERYYEMSLPRLLTKTNNKFGKNNLIKLKEIKNYFENHTNSSPDPGSFPDLIEMISNLDTLR